MVMSVGWLVFYGISILVGYLKPNLVFIYMCGGARGVMVIVIGMRLIAFHIALIPLGKIMIQLFFLQLWISSRADLERQLV